MSLNAIASFSLLWHDWNTFPSSTSSRTNFVQGTYPGSYLSRDNLCSSEDGLNLTVHFNPGATQLFLDTCSALSQPFNSLDVWLRHIAPSSIVRPFQEMIWQDVFQSPHYHEFCKQLPYNYDCHIMFQCCRNPLVQVIIRLAFNDHTCITGTNWHKTMKVISFGCTPSSHTCPKCLRASSVPMRQTSSKYGGPSYMVVAERVGLYIYIYIIGGLEC
jgi:hypothetical protein